MTFDDEVSERLRLIINQKGIKQSSLLLKCKKVNMPLSQPDISKIYGGKRLSLYQASAICKAIDISLDKLVGTGADKEDFCDTSQSVKLLSVPKSDEFNCYLGDFYTYFLSTAEGEHKIIEGFLSISEETGYYKARMAIGTGIRDYAGKEIQKSYQGRLIISISLGSAYLIFKSEELGEICAVDLRHRLFNIKQVECRMGLCLTTCAGEEKIPAVHKILFVRNRLTKEGLQQIEPWLKLYENTVWIEKSKFESLIAEFSRSMPEYQEELHHMLKTGICRSYYSVSSDFVRKQLSMGKEQYIQVLTALYANALLENNIKISQNEDNKVFELYCSLSAASVTAAMSDS